MNEPSLVAHADWSVQPAKRWLAVARFDGDVYHVDAPRLVGPLGSFLSPLLAEADSGGILLGFDFPIGLPRAFAERAGITSFLEVLPRFGQGKWERFFDVAERPDQVSLLRPFYPYRPGRTEQDHLIQGLGVVGMSDLLRECDRAYGGRKAACSMFWTLGPKQVGKAAINGWREVLVPALRPPEPVAVWPFDGGLDSLLSSHSCIVAETYPAESCIQLGLSAPGSTWKKTSQEDRGRKAVTMLAWAASRPVLLASQLVATMQDGFGPSQDGEDRFDALVGLLGMLDVVNGYRSEGPVSRSTIQSVEGWIFGLTP